MFRVHRRWPVLLAFIAVLFFSAPLVAQDRRDDQGWRSGDAQDRAYNNGYHQGQERGRDDARKGRVFDYTRDKEYRKADEGYNRRYGDRNWYRDEFRRGYVAGYSQAYNQYAPRGSYDNRGYGYGYPQYEGRSVPRPYSPDGQRVGAGYNRGYNDGLDKGRDDVRHGRRYEPTRFGWYRDGDRGYDRAYGPKGNYATTYRQGFINGYGAGYGNAR
jgi:hypothetical protein